MTLSEALVQVITEKYGAWPALEILQEALKLTEQKTP